MTVIDLASERAQRAEPHPDCRTTDDHGRTLYIYLTEWVTPDGRVFGGEVVAYSEAEAIQHVDEMRQSLRVVGRLHERVPPC